MSYSRDTSDEAFDSIDHSTLRIKVFKELLKHKTMGRTCDELEQDLGMIHQTCSARVNELMNKCWIYDSGYRRRTRNGRNAIVWLPVENADERLALFEQGAIT